MKRASEETLFGTGVRRICAVAAAATATEMRRLVLEGLRETPTIELRLDWLRSDSERSRFLRWLRRNRPRGATFIATCRRRVGGGKLAGGFRRELYWLAQACEAGCAWCDLEIETLREMQDRSVTDLNLPPRILLSSHDFRRTPSRLEPSGSHADFTPAAFKIAANARTIADSMRILQLAKAAPNIVAVPMGEVGLPARLLALRAGSALAYAPIGEATAPGQVSLPDLKYLYRAHQLSSATRVFGVIANPVSHSLSPIFHNTGFVAAGLDAIYLPFLVKELRDFLKAVPEFGIRGFSVTIPHKQAILPYLKECDPLAAEIGAVNTVVVREDGTLAGGNTDYIGVLLALEGKLALQGSRVLIFGAGGSARAAAFALVRAGASVLICARRENAARELARTAGAKTIARRALRHEFFDAILNTTPVGMHPHDKVSPLSADELNCKVVMDFINRPQKTPLLKIAASKGIATVPGISMFFAQGIAQWELWTGVSAPKAKMERAVLDILRIEEKSPKRH